MLSDDLKARTRTNHDAAESSPAMQAVVADDLDRAHYRDHLVRLLAFYDPTEAALADVPGLDRWLPDLGERLVKAGWLREDLTALGPEQEAPSAYVPALALPDAFGVLYVIEGSTLGGRIIERQLGRSLGVTPDDGARFYHSYGDDRGPRWTAFKGALDAYGAEHPEAVDAVVRAASDTLDVLAAWLAPTLSLADA